MQKQDASIRAILAQEAALFDGSNVTGKVVQFSFEKATWEDVIKWFAEQTELSLADMPNLPEGTFPLDDDRKHAPIEAFDQLNYALRLQRPPYAITLNHFRSRDGQKGRRNTARWNNGHDWTARTIRSFRYKLLLRNPRSNRMD